VRERDIASAQEATYQFAKNFGQLPVAFGHPDNELSGPPEKGTVARSATATMNPNPVNLVHPVQKLPLSNSVNSVNLVIPSKSLTTQTRQRARFTPN
jgi:hypothetical protein